MRKKYLEIKKSIKKIGFEECAAIFIVFLKVQNKWKNWMD